MSAHIGLEGNYHSRRVDIWDISVDSAESLQIIVESLSFFILEKLQVARSVGLLVATGERTDELVANVCP